MGIIGLCVLSLEEVDLPQPNTFLGCGVVGLHLLGKLWVFCKARFSFHTFLSSVSCCAYFLYPTVQCLGCTTVFNGIL